MEEYHPLVQEALKQLFAKWKKATEKLCGALQSGKATRIFVKHRMPVIINNATLQAGLYLYHDLPLATCLEKHNARWKNTSQEVLEITKTFYTELSKRCLSVAEIVVAMFLVKERYFVTTAQKQEQSKTDCVKDARQLELPHYNPGLSWQSVFDHIQINGVARQQVTCNEMEISFRESFAAVIRLLQQDKMALEGNLGLLQRWRTSPETISDSAAKELCFGGLSPAAVMQQVENDDQLQKNSLDSYQLFEGGDFKRLTSLLLMVQISIRVILLLLNAPDFPLLTGKERELQFANVTLYRIIRVLEKNTHPYVEFGLPTSFKRAKEDDDVRFLLECELLIDNVPHQTILELPVLYYLFGETSHQLFCDAFAEFYAIKQRSFIEAGKRSPTVTHNGITMPAAWARKSHFENLRV